MDSYSNEMQEPAIIFSEILDQNPPNEPSFLKKVRNFYRSCMDLGMLPISVCFKS